MFKLANQILDAYDDIAKEGLKKLAQVNPRIYVMTNEELSKLADEDFALSVITKKASKLNKFPIDSHDNAWLSNQYFEMNHEKLPKTAASIAAYHIKTACERFNINPTPAVEGLAKEARSNVYVEEDYKSQKIAAKTHDIDMAKFAEVENIADNYTHAQYAMKTPAHVKMASKYFDEYCEKIPMEYRHKYASAIQRRSHELGMGAQQGKVVKYASDHYSGHLDAHLRSRASLLEVASPQFRSALDKLASMKQELEPSDFAKVLHGFDKRAGLDRYYGRYLTDPYQATFGMAPNPYSGWRAKTAAGNLSADEVAKVATEKYAKIKEYFGKNVADELQKHGAPIFDSLPKDAQEVIVGIANGAL